MTKIQNSEQTNELLYTFDFVIDSKEYEEHKSKIVDQMVKNVEIKGYRKGKVPRDKAMESIDQSQLQQTVYTETLQKHAQEATETARKEVGHRKISSFQFDINPENTKETDNGFVFRLVAHLLPKIDLTQLDKIKVDEPTSKDIKDQPKYSDFEKEEVDKMVEKFTSYEDISSKFKKGDKLEINMTGKVDGKVDERLAASNFTVTLGQQQFIPGFEEELMKLKSGEEKSFTIEFPKDYFEKELAGKEAEFTVNVIKASRAKSTNIEDVIKENEQMKERFKSADEVKDYIKKFYDAQTEQILKEMKQKNIIQAVVEQMKDFTLPEDKINMEVERIVGVVKTEAENKKVDLGEAFATSGLPGSDNKKAKSFDEKEVTKSVKDYVSKEFKLSALLSYIYSELAEDKKIKEEELETIVKQAEENKQQFQIPEQSTTEDVRNILTDRMVRQSAVMWLYEKFDATESEEHVHDENCDHDHK